MLLVVKSRKDRFSELNRGHSKQPITYQHDVNHLTIVYIDKEEITFALGQRTGRGVLPVARSLWRTLGFFWLVERFQGVFISPRLMKHNNGET